MAQPGPLYRILLSTKEELTSLDARQVRIERHDDGVTLRFERHKDLDLTVVCRMRLDGALSRWRISITNHTSRGIRAVRYPVVLATPVLGASDQDDEFISGSWGCLRRLRPAAVAPVEKVEFRCESGRNNWLPQHYPGTMAVQMMAFYDRAAGLYIATEDSAGYIKHFGFGRLKDALDLSVEHDYDTAPGRPFELPYDTVLGLFHGDWHDAADIYKDWARRQPWCAKRLTGRDDLPAWLTEPRPWLAVISRGNYQRLPGLLNQPPAEYPIAKFWPARKVVPLMRRYANALGTPVLTWMEGWEKIGSPGGPAEIFPPLEGEASYKAAMSLLTRDGNPPIMYLAGFHWTYKRPTTGYDDWPRFEREGRPMAVIDDHGKLLVSDMEHRVFGDGQKYFVTLCGADRRTQDLFLRNFLKLADLGAVGFQLDQQLGFHAVPCYSAAHGHPPGYGPWMTAATHEFIRKTARALRERTPRAAFGSEGWCEQWIQDQAFALYRPYGDPDVPLFDYLYHEYALSYGGDLEIGVAHPEAPAMKHARIFVLGLQNFVGIGQEEYDLDVDPSYGVLVLLKNIARAQRTIARDYVVFGEMLKPAGLKVASTRVDLYRRPGTSDMPRVFHNTWRAPGGRVAHVLANWTAAPEQVTLTWKGVSRTLTVPARDVTVVEEH